MTSAIDPTRPIDAVPAVKSDLRDNLQAAKTEIEAIQRASDPHVINAAEHGVVADGTTDNTNALYALFDTLRANREPFYRVVFPEGAIQYSVNGWLAQCGKVILDAYGTSFQCTQTGGLAGQKYPLSTGDWQYNDLSRTIWENTTNGVFNSPNISDGFLIDTVDAGSLEVIFKTGQTLPNFDPGDLVVVQGYDHQELAGFPRNMRFFDYLTVDTWTPGTRTLTFLSSLTHRYDDQWPDSNGHGAARVFICRGASKPNAYWNEQLEIWGATFLANPNDPTTGDNVSLTPEKLVLRDVDGPGLYLSLSRSAEAYGGSFKIIEIDKLGEDAVLDKVQYSNLLGHNGSTAHEDFGHINSATGFKNVTIRNVDFHGYINDLTPIDNLCFERCSFRPRSPQNYTFQHAKVNYPTRHVIFKECYHPLRGVETNTAVLSVITDAGTTGRDLVFSGGGVNKAESLRLGLTYWTLDGKGGVCTELTGDGAGNVIMRLDSADTFAAGETLFFHSVGEMSFDRPRSAQNQDTPPFIQQPILNQLGLQARSRQTRELTITNNDVDVLNVAGHIINLRGQIDEIVFDVFSAGPAGKNMQITYAGNATTHTTDTIDCGVSGARTLAATPSGSAGADSLTADFAGNFLHQITLLARDGGGVGWGAVNYFERAKFSLKLKGLFI